MANLEVIALDASTPQLRAPGAGDSYAMPRPVIQQVGVLTTDVKVVERSATWNNAAVTFTGYKINITDTASAAGSLLLDLQVGGISKADISKSGVLGFTGQFGYKASIKGSLNGSRVLAVGYEQSGTVTEQCWIGYSVGFRCVTSGHFSWGTSSGSGLYDLALERDAANTLAQRNGVNAQAFRVYNTYTDASNYERGVFDWTTTANFLTIGTQAAGTGSNCFLRLVGAGGYIYFSVSGGDRARISSADLSPTTDNGLDIGTAGMRWKNGYFAGTTTTGGYTVATLPAAGTAGRRAYVTDATAPTFLGILTGGGSVVTPVFDNGTAWVAG